MGFEPGTLTTNPEHTHIIDHSAMAPLFKVGKNILTYMLCMYCATLCNSHIPWQSLTNYQSVHITLISIFHFSSIIKVNVSKTEICLYFKNNHRLIEMEIDSEMVRSKPSMNVLGVRFDLRLQWTEQVTMAINKSKRTLNAIKLTNKHVI